MISLMCETKIKQKHKLIDQHKDSWLPEAKGAGVGKMNEGSQKDNSDYKRNKSWGCNVPHGGEKKPSKLF